MVVLVAGEADEVGRQRRPAQSSVGGGLRARWAAGEDGRRQGRVAAYSYRQIG
jgi:hypothetical protein